ncbi:MAG: F0F1 ATP synthase subunit A [Bacteroidales bacterium]|nr:F0F1 ATP synthase subunit A [Bacteroidales bacterium]
MKRVLFFCVAFLLSIQVVSGIDTDTSSLVTDTLRESHAEKFAPGEFMLEHILDSHEWHIITLGDHHISIPLPVILYSKESGWHFFMSSKFHHGQTSYKNFRIATEGPNKGKIVEQTAAGEIVPLDLSITKVVFSIIFSSALLLWIFISIARRYQKYPHSAPKGLQSALEPFILFIRDDIAKSTIGEKRYEKYLPYLLTLFFFIWFNNMLGLIPIFPGGANVTGNIAVTGVMALFTFVITTISANKHYWQEIYNAPGVPWWLKFPIPLMPMIELLGMFIKPVVLMVRLFANIVAGHLIILAFVSLIFIFAEFNPILGYAVSPLSAAFSIFMGMLELLVALIQAYVFTLLSAIYFGLATAEHHEGH